MTRQNAIASLFVLSVMFNATGEELKSGEYLITQTWSQESNYRHPYYVNVPENTGTKPLPVFIFLHGNGGNAQGSMRRFLRPNGSIRKKFIIVFPQGYQRSWNIVSERSKADDLAYIEAIIKTLSSCTNVQKDRFGIMGSSNGAAMVNQIAIETELTCIKNYICIVSPLNTYQHDEKNFKLKGKDNNYTEIATPLTGKRLMNVSGTKDALVPYLGGPSKSIPAKDGKLSFLAAEESTFLWAKHMGYKGKQLTEPTAVDSHIEMFSYLNGDVIHYKVIKAGHNAGSAIKEDIILKFLEGGR
ncbi:MAG: hypothetical protein H8E62_06280 [Planctomycetes bacterium]|nr:hypothetical protein [Planctomycetota bacterium]